MEVISRLLNETDFRNNFFTSPKSTLQKDGIRLSPADMAMLKEMDPEDLEGWITISMNCHFSGV